MSRASALVAAVRARPTGGWLVRSTIDRAVAWKISSAASAGATISSDVSAGPLPRCVNRSPQKSVPRRLLEQDGVVSQLCGTCSASTPDPHSVEVRCTSPSASFTRRVGRKDRRARPCTRSARARPRHASAAARNSFIALHSSDSGYMPERDPPEPSRAAPRARSPPRRAETSAAGQCERGAARRP